MAFAVPLWLVCTAYCTLVPLLTLAAVLRELRVELRAEIDRAAGRDLVVDATS